jgi:hypothetical protein
MVTLLYHAVSDAGITSCCVRPRVMQSGYQPLTLRHTMLQSALECRHEFYECLQVVAIVPDILLTPSSSKIAQSPRL